MDTREIQEQALTAITENDAFNGKVSLVLVYKSTEEGISGRVLEAFVDFFRVCQITYERDDKGRKVCRTDITPLLKNGSNSLDIRCQLWADVSKARIAIKGSGRSDIKDKFDTDEPIGELIERIYHFNYYAEGEEDEQKTVSTEQASPDEDPCDFLEYTQGDSCTAGGKFIQLENTHEERGIYVIVEVKLERPNRSPHINEKRCRLFAGSKCTLGCSIANSFPRQRRGIRVVFASFNSYDDADGKSCDLSYGWG